MKLKLITAALIVATSSVAFAAVTDEGSYFKIQAGSTNPKKVKGQAGFGTAKVRNSAILSAEFGGKVDEHVNLGLGIDYRPNIKTKNLLASQKTNNLSAMVNAYYTFNEMEAFKPYLTIGAGVAGFQTKKSSISKKTTKTNFAYQLGAGVNFAVNETTDFGIGYRFVDAGKFNKSYKSRFRTNEFLGGITVKVNS